MFHQPILFCSSTASSVSLFVACSGCVPCLQWLMPCMIASAVSGSVLTSSIIHLWSLRVPVVHVSVAPGCLHCRMCGAVSTSSLHRGHTASALCFHLSSVSLVPMFPENIFTTPMVLVLFSLLAACARPVQFTWLTLSGSILPFSCQYCWSILSCLASRILVSMSVEILVFCVHSDQHRDSRLLGWVLLAVCWQESWHRDHSPH